MNDMLLLALMFSSFQLSTDAWQNDWDSRRPIYLQCSEKSAIYRINNEYNIVKQGRRWDYGCRRLNAAIGSRYPEICPDNINEEWVGDEWHMTCRNGSVLRKVWFYRRTYSEHLRWRLTCCRDSRNRHTTRNCSVTGWVNDWNRSFDYSAPSNKVLNGIVSKWSTRFLDRKFKFSVCDYN